MRLFIFGFGYSGKAVWRRMRPKAEKAWGTTRDEGKLEEIDRSGIVPLPYDASPLPSPPPHPAAPERSRSGFAEAKGRRELSGALREATHILVSIPPDKEGDPVLRDFSTALAAAKPASVVYLSTVGVYGDHGGAWVDEASACRPVAARSSQRLAAEVAWQSFSSQTGVPVAILRLAGIYGLGRGPFEKIRRGTARRILKPGQVFNRIHVEDIGRIVDAAFERRANGIFNGVDDEPAPPQDVIAYAAELLGVAPPPGVPFDEARLTPMARSFYGENKRVRNDKIKRELGVTLAYPTYRDGLRAVLAAEKAR
jgi:dTDP-4-dehydrorhamnose reductase